MDSSSKFLAIPVVSHLLSSMAAVLAATRLNLLMMSGLGTSSLPSLVLATSSLPSLGLATSSLPSFPSMPALPASSLARAACLGRSIATMEPPRRHFRTGFRPENCVSGLTAWMGVTSTAAWTRLVPSQLDVVAARARGTASSTEELEYGGGLLGLQEEGRRHLLGGGTGRHLGDIKETSRKH